MFEPAAPESTKPFILQCLCGQKSWISGFYFNRPSAMNYGTHYSCPSCKAALGAPNFMFPEQAEDAAMKDSINHGLDAGLEYNRLWPRSGEPRG